MEPRGGARNSLERMAPHHKGAHQSRDKWIPAKRRQAIAGQEHMKPLSGERDDQVTYGTPRREHGMRGDAKPRERAGRNRGVMAPQGEVHGT